MAGREHVKAITTVDPEFQEILNEFALQRDAIQRRRALGEASFRRWMYEELQRIASRMGYTLQSFGEFMADMGKAAKDGFNEGRQLAKEKSIRRHEARED